MTVIEGPWLADPEMAVLLDPQVRQARRVAVARRGRLLASVVGTGDSADTDVAGRLMIMLQQASVIAGNDEDRARARHGLISRAEADRRIAVRDAEGAVVVARGDHDRRARRHRLSPSRRKPA